MKKLLIYEGKRGVRRLWWAALLLTALSVGAVFLYQEDVLRVIDDWRGRQPWLSRALGLVGSENLSLHLVSLVAGLLAPLVMGFFALGLAIDAVNRNIHAGRLALYLSTPRGRGPILLALTLPRLAALTVVAFGPYLIAFLVSVRVLPDQASLKAALLLALGLWALGLILYAFFIFVAVGSPSAGRARLWGAGALCAFVILLMLSRAEGQLPFLAWLTPLSLYDPAGLLRSKPTAWWLSASAVLAAVIVMVLAIGRFLQRELYDPLEDV